MADLTRERKSLVENTVEELLGIADEFDTLAASAATPDAKEALDKLATRFRIFAAGRASRRTVSRRSDEPVTPGSPAPSAGIYELRNVFGTRAGEVAQVRRAELLPRAPRGFTWQLVHEA